MRIRKIFCFSALLFFTLFISIISRAQQTTLTGTVINSETNEKVSSVSVIVKGTSFGTYTNSNGAFTLDVPKLPVTLIVSSISYQTKEVVVADASRIQVSLAPGLSLGQEVVVSATRTPQRILESPVSIERINAAAIANAAVPDYYESLRNLKGVDLTTSSLTFKTVSTRGFNGSGALRVNQFIDGMDNQAPGLNFSVGSIVGPTELDVDNVELLPGASSALYGSGGMNGTILITSKSPFKYQGLSFQVKQGINHVGDPRQGAAPYYDWAMRWGKVIGKRFAFKISGQFIRAEDWQAYDDRNIARTNVFSKVKPGTRQSDPNYDGINVYGDEVSAGMGSVAQAIVFGPPNIALPGVTAALAQALGRPPTQAEIINYFATSTNPALAPLVPFAAGLKGNLFGGQFVSRTGYNERDLVDYNAYNFKATGGLYYKITDDVEASLIGNWGTGTTVYTGADRYALKNLKMGQYKGEVKGANWFLRAYTTQENSGDSYTATTAAIYINRVWRSDANWFAQYTGNYAGARLLGASDAQAQVAARTAADQGRFLPGSADYKTAFDNAIHTSIKDGGARFDDRTNLYQFEGQYNLNNYIKFVDVLVGANYRIYHLNSHGTIFVDTTGPINVHEAGAYVQLQKSLLNDVLRLTGSLRYDKNQNFKGRVTPRATALIKVAPNNNIRLSFQTAYRFPDLQDQYINLAAGGGARLIGGLPQFNTYFGFDKNPSYTAESIVAYRNSLGTGPNPTLLKQAQFQTVKPETMNSYEIGYKGLVTPKLLIDVYGYYSQYKDFIGRIAVGRGNSGTPQLAPVDLANPFTTNNYSFVLNTTNNVTATGWGVSADYQLGKGYMANVNMSSDQLGNVPENVFTQFNTPKLRYNIGFSNARLTKSIGFNLVYRWQDQVNWQGTFAMGDIPAFGTMDAQVSYKFTSIKSMIKLGGSNIFNHYYFSAFGNPQIGAVYYISIGYNIF